jgi:hypothetical protein
MEKQNQFVSLMALLPNGKVENDVRITETTVTGRCTVYLERADDENAFFLRDIGVALIGDDLTSAVRIAIDQAYGAAVSHLAAMTPAASQQSTPKTKQENTQKTAPATQQVTQEHAPAAEPETEVDPEHPPVDLNSIVDLPGQNAEDVRESQPPRVMTGEQVGENIERVDFTENLFGKSDTQEPAGTGDEGDDDDDTDPEYQKALDTEITIFGKLHVCNGWKAGRILSEQPAVIIDFCQRNSEGAEGPKYSGPKTDQKEALFKLYPDAALKVQKAA